MKERINSKIINCLGLMKTIIPHLPNQCNIINGTLVAYDNDMQYHFRNSEDGKTVHMEIWEEETDGSITIEKMDIDEETYKEYIREFNRKKENMSKGNEDI